MKVLKEENLDNWKIEKTCSGHGNGGGGCGIRVKLSQNDIFITNNPPSTEYFYTFKCPKCGKFTDIPEKDIPNEVQKNASNKFAESLWNLCQ